MESGAGAFWWSRNSNGQAKNKTCFSPSFAERGLTSCAPKMVDGHVSICASGSSSVNNRSVDRRYDYNMDESHNTFAWGELLPALIVYGTTLVLGLVGNSLIVYATCRYRRMRSGTNVFLASLASADLLLIVICIPVKIAKLFSYTWALGLFLCKSVHYMQNVSAICSVLTLTAMSIERYYAIVHPMKARYICTVSQARRIIAGIWLASLLLAIPILFAQVQMQVGEKFKAYWCVRDWDNVTLWRAYEIYMLVLVLLAPTAAMSLCYAAICCEIWKVTERRHRMTGGRQMDPRIQSSAGRPIGGEITSCGKVNYQEEDSGLLKQDDKNDGDKKDDSNKSNNNSGNDQSEDVGASKDVSPNENANSFNSKSYNLVCDNGEVTSAAGFYNNCTDNSVADDSLVENGLGDPKNYIVMQKLHKGKVKRRRIGPRTSSSEQKMVRQVIHMLSVVVTLFAVCWSPLLVDNVMTSFGLGSPVRQGPNKHWHTAFHLMAYFNSCINPIVYGFMSKSFRDSFALTLCCSSKGAKGVRRDKSRNWSSKSSKKQRDRTLIREFDLECSMMKRDNDSKRERESRARARQQIRRNRSVSQTRTTSLRWT
ncbi:somatostatin receptor type 1-like [Ctenocephalides felis]|uniref:somatostatin receptor type 1-like n=1 Tax=Ctenocephalides felis TaxID=7515 RepID=UPI000E6E5482|nr:somatostatin receptor type 1-like [Ctenocephalides felis]